MKHNDELESYKDAVWDFLLEHCDITDGGALFIKFHTDGRANFERRVKARWKYGYHREDVRAKEERHLRTSKKHRELKQKKKAAYQTAKRKRIKKYKRKQLWRKFLTIFK